MHETIEDVEQIKKKKHYIATIGLLKWLNIAFFFNPSVSAKCGTDCKYIFVNIVNYLFDCLV